MIFRLQLKEFLIFQKNPIDNHLSNKNFQFKYFNLNLPY